MVPRGPPWEDALRKIADGSPVYVRVELIPKHMKTVAAADAVFCIDRFGKVSKKPIALRSHGTSDRVNSLVKALELVFSVPIISLIVILMVCSCIKRC